jgi:endonuclease III
VVRRDTILRVCRALAKGYGNPRLGNKANALDELVYIILSTRTQDHTFRLTFTRLKAQFPSWNGVANRDRRRIERILRPAGLSKLKARQLLAILERLRSSFGRATLAPMHRLPNRQAEAFLTSLPGVASKVAKCVLMYSLRRQVLPVDVHVHRVATRLGLKTKKRPDTSQDLIEGVIPPRLRYGFHVNAVAHGRAVCLPHAPRCDVCCVAKWCHYYRVRTAKAS